MHKIHIHFQTNFHKSKNKENCNMQIAPLFTHNCILWHVNPLLGSGFQRWSLLCFRVQRLLSSPPGTFQLQLLSCTNWLPTVEVTQKSKSKSKLLYDWRFTANQFILAPSPLRITTRVFCNWTLAVMALMQHPLWWEDGFVSYEYVCPSVESLYSLGTDRIENTSPNSSSIVASRRYSRDRVENNASRYCCVLLLTWNCCVRVCWRSRYIATSVFAEPFPSNDCLSWRHSSCLEQMCHIILVINDKQVLA
jgi:hypothetical protein